MKYLLTLLIATGLWSSVACAQSGEPAKVDSLIHKDVKTATGILTDTTRKDKLLQAGENLKTDITGKVIQVPDPLPDSVQWPVTSDVIVERTSQEEAEQLKEIITRETGKEAQKKMLQQSIDDGSVDQLKAAPREVTRDVDEVKSSITAMPADLKQQVTAPANDVGKMKLSKEERRELLEDKATSLQYSSDDPDSAPWKKKDMLTEDDLSALELPDAMTESDLPLSEDALSKYRDKIEDLDVPELSGKALEEKLHKLPETAGKSLKQNRAAAVLDSMLSAKDRLNAEAIQEKLLGAKKVYSKKYIKRVYDSLGASRADSIFKPFSGLIKKSVSEEDLLDQLNRSMTALEGVSYNKDNQSLKLADAEKLQNQLADPDIGSLKDSIDVSRLQLPQDVLSDLPPLPGNVLDEKYLPYVDSVRKVAMKKKKLLLDEDSMTAHVKRTVIKKKPRFIDKIYFEGILSFTNDSTINIIKLSPSLGYHFTDVFSVGAGPNVLVQVQERKLNALAGIRTFAKAEVWKQRAYLQLEDHIDQVGYSSETLKQSVHSVLGGGGVILPFTRSLAFNVSVLYRLYDESNSPARSPWVFRVGISTIKKQLDNR